MKSRMNERRVLKRRHLVIYLDVLDRSTGEILGQLGDISTEGLLLISKEALSADKAWQLRIALPEERGAGSYLDLDALPCWSSPDLNPELVCTGFSFINAEPRDQKTIKNLIQTLGFRD